MPVPCTYIIPFLPSKKKKEQEKEKGIIVQTASYDSFPQEGCKRARTERGTRDIPRCQLTRKPSQQKREEESKSLKLKRP